MKILNRLIPFIAALLLPTALYAVALTVTSASKARLGEDAFEHRYAAAIVRGPDVMLALQKRSVGNSPGLWKSWIWSIDSTGKLLQAQELVEPNQPPDVEGPEVTAMTALTDGAVACAVVTRTGELKIVRVAPGKDPSWSLGDKSLGNTLRITRIFQTADGNLLIVGQHRGKASYMKYTVSGTRLWELSFDNSIPGAVFDGIPTPDGGAYLVADFWKNDPYMMGDSSVWIAKVGTNGDVTKQQKLSGRRPRIASSNGDGFVLAYDQSETVAQKIMLQKFGSTLDPSWSSDILSNTRGLETFKVEQLNQGGFVVAGGDDLTLSASLVDPDGKKSWTFKDKDTRSSDFNILIAKDQFFLIYPVISVVEIGSKRQLNTKIGISSFNVGP